MTGDHFANKARATAIECKRPAGDLLGLVGRAWQSVVMVTTTTAEVALADTGCKCDTNGRRIVAVEERAALLETCRVRACFSPISTRQEFQTWTRTGGGPT